jgi:hypothetical protein
MFATFISVALFAASALTGLVAAEPVIDTPKSITQCQPVQLNWSGASGKANLIAVAASDPCGKVFADLGDHTGKSFTWTPKLPVGEYMISLEDEEGEESWTGAIKVLAAKDQSCLPAELKSSSSASAPGVAPTTATDDPLVPVGAAGTDPLSSSNSAAGSKISLPLMVVAALVGAVYLI